MFRRDLALAVTVFILVAAFALVAYLALAPQHTGMGGGHMGGWMGHMGGWAVGWVFFLAALLVIVALALLIVAWVAGQTSQAQNVQSVEGAAVNRSQERRDSLSLLLSVLREDERIVVKYLVRSGGRALQRDIVRNTSLSKVQVHRALKRLAGRGVISIEKHGKTNMVRLEVEY